MSIAIEAFYIFDEQKTCILEHVYSSRPPTAKDLIQRFSSLPTPRPSVLYLPDLHPPTTAFSITHTNLLLLCTCSTDVQALGVLEFLHRVVDVFEEFLGSPLLASKIEDNYEVVAQLLNEICDGGIVCNTESNALRESVEVSSTLSKLFSQVGLPGSPALSQGNNLAATLKAQSTLSAGPAIPWRKSNVRHTSNELYVDIVEQLSIIYAPSGRPLSARSRGSIMFTAKISGIPDLLLCLAAPGGASNAKEAGISRTMQLPVFHPCVRLARWRDRPGDLSFVPPDGKFMLAGYEVDLLPSPLNADQPPPRSEKLFMPAVPDFRAGLGTTGCDFETRLTLNSNFPGAPTARAGPSASTGPFSFGRDGNSSAPTLEALIVTIPFPPGVRNVLELKPSRGEATYNLRDRIVEWKVPTKDGASVNGVATLTGTISGPLTDELDDTAQSAEDEAKSRTLAGYYDEEAVVAQSNHALAVNGENKVTAGSRLQSTKMLMPRSVSVSFAVKGWLPSGIKVDSLNVDVKNSKGLGEGVRPVKGVKYLTVSKKGIERRVE